MSPEAPALTANSEPPPPGPTPVGALTPRHPPGFVAGFLVEGDQERFFLIVDLQEDALPVDHRGTRRAPAHLHGECAQVLLPHELAGEVVAIEAVHAEIGVDVLAVRHRCLGRVGVGGVCGDARLAFQSDLFPEHLAAGAIEAVDLPAINPVRRRSAAAEAAASAAKATTAAAEAATTAACAHLLELFVLLLR